MFRFSRSLLVAVLGAVVRGPSASAAPSAADAPPPAPRILIGTEAGKAFAEGQGAVLKQHVKQLDLFSLEVESEEVLQALIKKAQDMGFTAEKDQVRTLVGLRANGDRRLAEDIPWGINRVYERDGTPEIPPLDYFPLGDAMMKSMCVIDSGYTNSHPDLPDGVQSANPNFPDISDSGGACVNHGTHVTGTIQATGGNGLGVIGVYPGADTSTVVKAFDLVFFGLICGFTYSSGLIGAAYDCADAGASVINMSLGGAFANAAEDQAFYDLYHNRGVLSVAAAGNGGNDDYSYPASYDTVMSVAATDVNNNLAGFSQTNNQVDISGPGVRVLSTAPPAAYTYLDGTSMASPHVAGVALVLRNKFPEAGPQLVRHALNKGAIDLGAPGYDIGYGNGLVNYWNSAEIVADCDEGVNFQATYRGRDYDLPCQWILTQTQFPPDGVCEYSGGNAGEVCTCVC